MYLSWEDFFGHGGYDAFYSVDLVTLCNFASQMEYRYGNGIPDLWLCKAFDFGRRVLPVIWVTLWTFNFRKHILPFSFEEAC